MIERRQSISEVSEATGVPKHLLRDWETKFPQLRPRRHQNGRRFYLEKDVAIIRRIHYLLNHEKLQIEGARVRLAQELHGIGRPRSDQETLAILDKMEQEIRSLIDLIDQALAEPPARSGKEAPRKS